MIIDVKDKKKFTLHVSLDEMRMLKKSLQCYGAAWSNDAAWGASYQIERTLASNRITFEEMVAEDKRLKSLGLL